MKRNCYKKAFIFGIIFLLLGSSFVSGHNGINYSSKHNFQPDRDKKIIPALDEVYPTMIPIPIESIKPETNALDITIVDTPDEFSWKNINGKDYTTPAKSQGNCGSCGIFSGMGALESIIKIREDRTDINPDLSEQYVLSCLPNAATIPGEGCSGGRPYMAYKLMMETTPEGNNVNGALFESYFPYQASDDIPCSNKKQGWEERLVPILDCGQIIIGKDSPENREKIKSIIMEKGPVAGGMYVPNKFVIWGILHHSPEDYYPYEERTLEVLNHGIMMLGWKDDPSIGNGGYWICKNSWGADWGYDGFYNIEYGALFTGFMIDWVDYESNSFDWPVDPHAPSSPSINGPTSGSVRTRYQYTVSSTDQDGDPLYYTVDWDDGSIQEWIGPFNSGEEITLEHSWNRQGSYNIKVKATDEWGSQSDWATISVSMPRNRLINNPIFVEFMEGFMDRFPLLESVEIHKGIKNDGVILFLAFPTEFYDYETNYTFFCPGRGFGIWITSEGIEYRKICGAILDKDKFYGIANPIIVLGIKVRDI